MPHVVAPSRVSICARRALFFAPRVNPGSRHRCGKGRLKRDPRAATGGESGGPHSAAALTRSSSPRRPRAGGAGDDDARSCCRGGCGQPVLPEPAARPAAVRRPAARSPWAGQSGPSRDPPSARCDWQRQHGLARPAAGEYSARGANNNTQHICTVFFARNSGPLFLPQLWLPGCS